jgi:acetyl-CoA C-acetyltransferase
MPEAVIVAAAHSPIGRANKGHLVEVRPDDLAAHVISKVMDKVPQIKPDMIDDLRCGCGLPGGEQGFNLGRVVSILSGLNAPGCTVNRYCSSSLATTRMAAHAIRAGEGDIFLSGARILCTLLNDLQTLDKTVGLETMCVGGGQGMALIVERLN